MLTHARGALLVALTLLAVCGAPTLAQQTGEQAAATEAAEPVRNTGEWNLPKKTRLAMRGYDPVSYFPEGGEKPVKGKPEFSLEHKGVVYHFATAEHRDLFKDSPEKYEPAYGGWCAWAMRDGDKVEVDPKSYLVQGGRLFLFYDGWLGDTRAKWLRGDAAKECEQADAAWKDISGEDPPPPDEEAESAPESGAERGKNPSG